MRCIPEEPEFGEGQLAEKAVWEALRNSLPDDFVLAHSVQVRDGPEHEIDCWSSGPALAWPPSRSRAAGQHRRRAVVPVGPLRGTQDPEPRGAVARAHSMPSRTGSRTSSDVALSSRCVYMVSLPYTDVPGDWAMAGCPRSLILDQTTAKSPAELVRRPSKTKAAAPPRWPRLSWNASSAS